MNANDTVLYRSFALFTTSSTARDGPARWTYQSYNASYHVLYFGGWPRKFGIYHTDVLACRVMLQNPKASMQINWYHQQFTKILVNELRNTPLN